MSQFSNRFCNDADRPFIYGLLRHLCDNFNAAIALPNDWSPQDGVPDSPNELPENHQISQGFIDYVDSHLGSETRVGLWASNEAAKKNPRPVTITREQLYKLWRKNGGSYDRFFGIKGSWKPLSHLLLSIEKIDVMKGYEEGNCMILLWRFNDARYRFMWIDFLAWRRGVLKNRAAFNNF